MFKVGAKSKSVSADEGRQPKLILTPEEPMSKSTHSQQRMVFCGIDVSAARLDVALIEPDRPLLQRQFINRSSGHKALIGWLAKYQGRVRVSLEATGIYSLDLALALDAAPEIEVSVLNPKIVNRFAQTLRRSKTDAADAMVLAEYSQRMPSMREKVDADADQDCGGPAAAVDVFLEEDFAGDGVGDQRERGGGGRDEAEVEVVQGEEQRKEGEGEKADAGEEERAGEDGADGALQSRSGRECRRGRRWISWRRR
jgi:hypothetical protein